MDATTAQGRYDQLAASRSMPLYRAREAAKLTIPALVPPVGSTQATRLPTPFQSTGARGVNNLSSKLLLSLFPPNQPFFRMEIGEFAIEQMTRQPGMKAQVDKALAKIEREVQTEVETSAIRTSVAEALKHLIVAGNVLLFMQPAGTVRTYHLGDYVVHRDPSGNVLEIITHEMMSPTAVPQNMRHLITDAVTAGNTGSSALDGKSPSVDKNVDLYTWVKRKDTFWTVHQEIKAKQVPGSQGRYPLDKSPWLPLRWSRVDGEDYGRGMVEEYQGDLQSLEGLTQAIVEGSAAMAKVIILVNPNGITKEKMIAEAPNGAVRAGREEDVKFMQAGKAADFRVAAETAQKINDALAYAFMLNSAIQRSAERVTAEEIRFMAQELETSLGGLYSLLSQELQLPLVKRLMFQMERAKKLPALPSKLIKPTIVTGLEALGRGNDLDRLDQFVDGMAEIFGPGAVQNFINPQDYLMRRATALGIDTENLVYTDDQIKQQKQQAMMQQAAMAAVPHGAKAIGDIATQSAKAGIETAAAGGGKPPAANGNQPPQQAQAG